MDLCVYSTGDTILREGELADCAYLIERGRVRVSRSSARGVVVLAELGAGELVGEMGVISEKPRSASVTALEECRLRRIGRDELVDTIQSDRQAAIALLKALFERLRQADARLAQLEQPAAHGSGEAPRARLVALTAEAREALGQEAVEITQLPLRIGRRDVDDPLGSNDLELKDQRPYNISRHHLLLDQERGRLVIYDRGSRLGSWVQGQLLGGASRFEGPVLLGEQPLELVLGQAESPMRFRLELREA